MKLKVVKEQNKSMLVWQKNVEEIEANELSSANDNTSVVSSAHNSSSSSSSSVFSRPRARGLELASPNETGGFRQQTNSSTSAEVSEEGTPRA